MGLIVDGIMKILILLGWNGIVVRRYILVLRRCMLEYIGRKYHDVCSSILNGSQRGKMT